MKPKDYGEAEAMLAADREKRMRDEFRDDLSNNAKLVDDLDALTAWGSRYGHIADEGGDPEFMDIIEHLTEDIRFLI